jgi:hypothetical protein
LAAASRKAVDQFADGGIIGGIGAGNDSGAPQQELIERVRLRAEGAGDEIRLQCGAR